MYYFLFFIYLSVAGFAITRFGFVKKSGLGTRVVLALFLLKIAAGLFIGWMSYTFYPGLNDYWGLNRAGWEEYQLMFSDPKKFFTDIFVSSYDHGYGGFFNSVGSYWNDIKNTFISKLLACCDIFSRGNFYINSMFFNCAGFLGHVALYRVFADIYKGKKWLVITGSFLLPSTLYFSSGIHKDLLVFVLLGFFCYALYFSLVNKPKFSYLITLIITSIGLLLIRNFVVVAMIPALIALVISFKKKWNTPLVFQSVYAVCIMLLGLLHVISPSFQPLKIITQKQQDFIDLPVATSQLELPVLEPTFKSLAQHSLTALDHGFFRPYIWEYQTIFLVFLAIELFIYELLFVLFLFRRNWIGSIHPFILFGIILACSMFLFTGYIVPNTGSIVRYRSLYLPFIITPLLCNINWNRFKLN